MTSTIKELEREMELAWLDPDTLDLEDLPHPLEPENLFQTNNPHLHMCHLLRQPKNFYLTCKILLNLDIDPFQNIILEEFWIRKFPILTGSRGLSKSFCIALYSLLRAIFSQGSRVVIVGAGFRQAKVIFEYIEKMIRDAPMLRNLLGNVPIEKLIKRESDKYVCTIGDSTIVAIPIGDGSRIRGLRATHTVCDEIASVNADIFETVVGGFSVVNQAPIEKVKAIAKTKMLIKKGILKEGEKSPFDIGMGNQTILSGTCYYQFNHFYEYWKKYKAIILSRGDKNKLEEIFRGEIPEGFNWQDYSIVRIPVDLLPDGFMDKAQVSKQKATITAINYLMEYAAVFPADSNGFYKRTLIESCVTVNPINLPSGPVKFSSTTRGDLSSKYVFGVDPASEHDNFTIIVLELHKDHTRIVYAWSTNRAKFNQRKTKGIAKEDDFYGYCARRIRDLAKVFPCERIGCDSQGGGRAVAEALHDSAKLQEGELPIWEVIDRDKPKDCDGKAGLHILELVHFSSSDWTSEANHGLRKDMEDKVLLFPFVDAISLELAGVADFEQGRNYDTLEDCVWEIEELKDELATIVHTQTASSGRDRWDTPEIKMANTKKGRQRKDRYSALLIANMLARTISRTEKARPYHCVGGFAQTSSGKVEGQLYYGPDWFTSQTGTSSYGTAVKRG